MKRYFVTGINTGVGKTVVSALLCEYLKADYFKPVQTGYPPDRDSEWIKNIVSFPITTHPECYLLKEPASPHLAAKRENVYIDIHQLKLPFTKNSMIIEGAGGLLVPLNERYYIADLIKYFEAECILVISNYLGCINHSLLSLFYIQKNNLPFKGIVLNGNFETEVKEAILLHVPSSQFIAEIPSMPTLNKERFLELSRIFQSKVNISL